MKVGGCGLLMRMWLAYSLHLAVLRVFPGSLSPLGRQRLQCNPMCSVSLLLPRNGPFLLTLVTWCLLLFS
jgi:hypothetical protein